jgi:cytochrome b6-f complex iron-sulfur subunit
MAEKKKLSVAEILAAARQADANKAKGGESAPTPSAAPPSAAAPAEAAAAPSAAPPAPKTDGGARPSVADILAMARAGKGAKAPAATEAKSAAPKPAAASAPAEKPKPAERPAAAAVGGGPKDTASILAAARKAARPGPLSKAEAASRATAVAAPPKPQKARPSVPPLPPKPEYARPKPKAVDEDRRTVVQWLFGTMVGLGFAALGATTGLWTLGFARFMFPNILTEPPSRFKVGFPSNFAPGQVETKFIAQYGVWVVNAEYNGQPQIFALRTVCTHLGCTPNWLEGEQKFKCPCHGSGFYKDGINFEGPAPRPLERYAIRVADDGQLEIDKSKIFQEEMGQWTDPTSFVAV